MSTSDALQVIGVGKISEKGFATSAIVIFNNNWHSIMTRQFSDDSTNESSCIHKSELTAIDTVDSSANAGSA